MSSRPAAETNRRRLAVHLLPVDVGRGAQRYAMSLRSQLDGDDWEHRILVLFRGDNRALEADDHLDVPQGRFRRLGLDPRAVIRLRSWLRSNRPDVLIAHGGEPYKYARLAVPRGLALLYYRIGVSQAQSRTGIRRAGYRFLTRRANLVAGVSYETLDDAHEVMGVPRDRLHLVANGRDAEPFGEARRAGSSDRSGPPHLIWVGHLTTGKRPGWFVDLVRRLRADDLDVRATLVGDGPLLEELRGPAKEAGIEMLGHRSDIPALLVDADIFCFTSSGESEGMPGVLIEAGLAGLATVATAVPGASTVIDDGRTGVVTPIDDFDGFLKQTTGLVQDDVTRSAMGRAALERCAVDFTLEASANRFQEILDRMVEVE